MMQSGHRRKDLPVWNWIRRDFALKPARPVLDGEPNYEDHPVKWEKSNGYFRDYDVRKQLYLSVFSGACGVTYGHHSVWQFYADTNEHPYAYPDRFWQAALKRPGAVQAGYLKRLMLTVAVNARVADQSIIERAQDQMEEYMTALRGTDSSLAMVYLPVGQTVTLNTGRLKGKSLTREWFDAVSGRIVKTGRGPKKAAGNVQAAEHSRAA